MSFNRLALYISCLMLGLGVAFTAHAKTYSLVAGGGELAIGQGLPLPAQVFGTSVTGTVFPKLLVPVAKPRPVISGTTVMTVQQKLTIPTAVLQVGTGQRTVGLFNQNPSLYAVATNLGWSWPAAPAVMSTAARTGNKTTTWSAMSGTIRYSNPLANKFGGPARFAIIHGVQPQGIITNSPVTIYALAGGAPGAPPCTHPAVGGTNAACVAILMGAWPLTQGVIGAQANLFAATVPLGNPVPGIGVGKFGATPPGTVSLFFFTPNGNPGLTNMASSVGYPWTTGMLTIMQPFAKGAPETFTLTGMDDRTPGGSGTIQLVSGSISQRQTSGPNANRGWVRLVLGDVSATPSMSPAGVAATAGLMLLAVGYALRKRFLA